MEKILSKVKVVHFVGIGGIGMTGLAFLLKDRGLKVRGSDIKDSGNTELLRREGIEVFIGHKKENVLPDTELIVYSSAVRPDNPELVAAGDFSIPIVKRGQLLGEVCEDKKTIAVAGSHGKTTTTSLTAYVLERLGYSPAFFVGGIPLNNNARNALWGGEYFVIETDESDGSFLYYHPWVSIVTNIDKEHLSIMGSISCAEGLSVCAPDQERAIRCGMITGYAS